MQRREFLRGVLTAASLIPGLECLRLGRPDSATSSGSKSSKPTESLEATRRSICDSIRTDPEMARDAIAFVDRWRGELGRIINIGSDLPS